MVSVPGTGARVRPPGWWSIARYRVSGPRDWGLRRETDALLLSLTSLGTLITFLLLYIFRGFDDNRLTSWRWAAGAVDAGTIMLLLAGALGFAYLLSAVRFPQRNRAPLFFLSSFLVAALFWSLPEVNPDAARYFTQAKYVELHGLGYFWTEWGRQIPAWTDMPLVPFAHGVILSLFGETRIGIQIFSALLYSGSVVLTLLIGRMLWGEVVGLCAAALLMGMPFLLTQVPLMLVDVPAMFFLTLAVFAAIRAVRNGGAGALAFAALAIALAMLSKYSVWLMLSVLPVIFLTHQEVGRRTLLCRASAMALGAATLVGLYVLWKFDLVAQQFQLLQTYQAPALDRWGESHFSTFLFQIHPFVAIAAVASVFVAIARRDAKFAIVAWMLALILILDIRRARYALIAYPMLALMAGYGMALIREQRVRNYVVACTTLSMLVTAGFMFLPFLRGTSAANIERAGAYLDSIEAEWVDVFTLPQTRSAVNPAISFPLLDLFTGKPVVYRPAPDAALAPPGVETSPVRFTWELAAPHYGLQPDRQYTGRPAIAVISGSGDQPQPGWLEQRLEGYRLSGVFARSDNAFRFQTIVKVYEPR